jgi:hypothetical protein
VTRIVLRANLYAALDFLDNAMREYKRADVLAGREQGWITANIDNLYNNQKLYSDAIEYLQWRIKHDYRDGAAREPIRPASAQVPDTASVRVNVVLIRPPPVMRCPLIVPACSSCPTNL